MNDFKLTPIPKPKEGTVVILELNKTGKFPIMIGDGEDNYLCGNCGNIIIKSMNRNMKITNVVFRCPNCRRYNLIK